MDAVLNRSPEKDYDEKKMSPREIHLLEAILHLLLYIGATGESSSLLDKAKGLVFTSGTNPITDYSRPQRMMGG